MKMTQQQVDEWNDTFPVGSPCRLRHNDDVWRDHHTRSIAWLLGHGQPVVKVDGKEGGWELDRIRMLETHSLKGGAE